MRSWGPGASATPKRISATPWAESKARRSARVRERTLVVTGAVVGTPVRERLSFVTRLFYAAGTLKTSFTVVLARSKRSVVVPPGKTILETLLDEGIDVPHSCTEGVCGSCETTVLDGMPDHRDRMYTPEERRATRTMTICCSGCLGERLVLDL